MNRMLIVAVALAAVLAGAYVGARSSDVEAPPPQSAKVEPPLGATLLPGLGKYEFRITTRNPEAQRWFNQAFMLTYGFNHDAAERSYLKAAQLDPDCAMCWWGASLVLGPHVNAQMDPTNNAKAWERLQRAVALAPKTTARRERLHPLAGVPLCSQPAGDRRALDEAYAKSTGELAQRASRRSRCRDGFTLKRSWTCSPGTTTTRTCSRRETLPRWCRRWRSVMRANPDHAGALHLYVHAVEASADPQRGVAAADRLRTLIPGSGHLVHMPAHIYARVGRWHDAVLANQVAIAADNAYLSMCRGNTSGVYPLGYVPHNPHFLWFAASMEGASKIAQDAARQTAERVNLPELMRQPGFAGLQHYWMTPWFDDVRFGRWDEIAGCRIRRRPAVRHGDLALRAGNGGHPAGSLEQANEHYEALAKLAADPSCRH